MDRKTALRCLALLGIGTALSTGHQVGIVAAIAMPPLAMSENDRRSAYAAAFCYYAGASWPVIPAARNFFGPSASLVEGIAAWLVAAVLLASPWPLAWTNRRSVILWRAPLALLATVIPPLGIIGWASPLTAAGFLFPHTAWFGLLACALVVGALAIWPLRATVVVAAAALVLNLSFPDIPAPPKDWEGVDTHFGSIAHAAPNPLSEYKAAEWIQSRALSSTAEVIVFPETVVPWWTSATEIFWQQTLDALHTSGKSILLGATLPIHPARLGHNGSHPRFDFSTELLTLRASVPGDQSNGVTAATPSVQSRAPLYQNAVLIRGVQSGLFLQRIPVPIGMWEPFSDSGVPINLHGPGILRIAKQRAAVLICYEQLLTWPILASMLERPTVILAVANDCWVQGTPVPRYQAATTQSWTRLFHVPLVRAVNI